MAQLFKEVIEEHGYGTRFDWIVFAILDDHHSGQKHNPQGNYQPFASTFSSKEATEAWEAMKESHPRGSLA